MSTTLKTAGEQTMLYRYDQLNRIKTAVSSQNTYQTGYSYDANGNILSLLRNDHNNNTIDNLSYSYNTNVNNRLNQIRDNSGDNTGLTSSPTPFSYQYDNIGNLIEDEEKEIGEITWTVYGKVQSVEKTDGTMISYKYDATGNRIYKKVNATETHYVRDASGNLMATYENKIAKEFVIYGSSRLGIYNGSTSEGKRTLGNKKYELSNHLGNVLSVISDNKLGIDSDADLIADYYEPLLISESDYYPYGMTMEKRSFASSEYRFGFNTQEKSTEIGEDTYTAEFWQYDSRNARRWNVDPVVKHYESSYAAFGGNPIWFADIDGEDTLKMHLERVWEEERVVLYKVSFSVIKEGVETPIETPMDIFLGQSLYSFEGWNRLGYIDPNSTSKTFKPTYEKMAQHSEWENTIRVYGDELSSKGEKKGVFIHPGRNIGIWSSGCLIAIEGSNLENHINNNDREDEAKSLKILNFIHNLLTTTGNFSSLQRLVIFV